MSYVELRYLRCACENDGVFVDRFLLLFYPKAPSKFRHSLPRANKISLSGSSAAADSIQQLVHLQIPTDGSTARHGDFVQAESLPQTCPGALRCRLPSPNHQILPGRSRRPSVLSCLSATRAFVQSRAGLSLFQCSWYLNVALTNLEEQSHGPR